MLLLILTIVLILALFGSLPAWPHSRGWGYYPSGGMGFVLVILLILFLMGRLYLKTASIGASSGVLITAVRANTRRESAHPVKKKITGCRAWPSFLGRIFRQPSVLQNGCPRRRA